MAITKTQKHTVKLTNAELFRQLMDLHGYSVRTLAGAVDEELAAAAKRANKGKAVHRRDRPTVHRATIGHLSSGERNTCSPEVAKAISKLFKLPVTALFTSTIHNVTRETCPTRTGRKQS